MPSHESPATKFLAKLAPMSAAGWHALGARIYPGELSVATDNGVYRFVNGVFLGRARKNTRSFDCPKEMRGLRLIGFLHDEGGLWSLSPRWREGSHAVLWKQGDTDDQSFVTTSPTRDFTLEEPASGPRPAEPEPKPIPWAERAATTQSGVMRRHVRAPSIGLRRPIPASMTRIHNALPAPSTHQ